MQNVDEFLCLLKGVKPAGDHKWMALCPAHSDKKRSLSITEVKDRILVNCLATCTIAQVLGALNLTLTDLFFTGGRPREEQCEIEAIYHYIDEKGKPFEVVRTRPKGFYQRRPDGKGGYINNIRGVKLTLYHQDKLKQAIESGKTLYFVEGEKDADRLWSLDIVATTNPMGAGKWRDNYTEALRGADVVPIPDNDGPGHDHVNHVAASVHGKAKRVRILELPPEYKDVSDWLDKGGDGDQLKQLLSQCSDYEPPHEPEEKAVLELDAKVFNLTDLGNAERLIKYYGDRLRYCYERKRWLVWDGKVWEWDAGGKIVALAKLTVRNIYHEAGDEPDEKKRKELADHAKRSESDHKIIAMINLAQAEAGVPIKVAELDTNLWLFNCFNGTLDLKTGQLLPHRREDLSTIIVPIDYHPDGQCPRWLSFLAQVTGGDADLAGYLQRAVGYSLTGETKTQVFFFLYGLGNNGKSTFTMMIRKLVAEYGAKLDIDILMIKKWDSGGPKEALMNLKGKRYVLASELESGKRLKVSLIKDMTGGETIKGRRLYEHELEYPPTHKLWLVGNHRPTVADTTLSIWRRLKLVPFTVTIPDKEIDLDLSAKLATELPGILAWAVKGCLDWQQYGLNEPASVTTATASYRQEQDILGDFIEDCCVLDLLAAIPKAELKEEYHRWCEDNSIDPAKQWVFKAVLTEKGITDGHSSDRKARIWCGLRLRTDKDPDIPDIPDKTSRRLASTGQNGPSFSKTLHAGGETKKVSTKVGPKCPTGAEDKSSVRKAADASPPYPDHPCPKCNKDRWSMAPDGHYYCANCRYLRPNPGEELRPCSCGNKDRWVTDDGQQLCTQCHPRPRER